MPACAAVADRHAAPAWIHDVLDALPAAAAPANLRQIRSVPGHSNDIVELTFGDDRILLVKRARHEWVRSCFAASARAGRLIAESSDLIVPRPLPLGDPPGLPVQAYWRIGLPTLEAVWPTLTRAGRRAALRNLGALLRRLHEITAPRWGPLHGSAGADDLAGALDRDLRQRLLPAVISHWPRGIAWLETLIARIPDVARLHTVTAPALIHTDLHLGNVLCAVRNGVVDCVGFLDLDGASGGVAESDIAGLDVLHGRIFQRYIEPALRHELRAGYGRALSRPLVDFFACVHLANQGFSSALLGHHEHAELVGGELARQLDSLRLDDDALRLPPTRARDGAGGAARYWQ